MLRRRILVYFVIATVASFVATVVFSWRASDRGISATRQDELRVARSVARFVDGMLEREGGRLEQMLVELPAASADAQTLRRHLQGAVQAVPGASGVWVFDRERRVVASLPDAGGVPPQTELFPALRDAAEHDRTTASDVWTGLDGNPRVALVRAQREGDAWRVAVASLRIDSPEFLQTFSYFLVDDRSRLQVLDSKGIAIFSTRPSERYRSVVHGTYFSDAVRAGRSTQMTCHSCHEDGTRTAERNEEVLTAAPVGGAGWSVTIRKSAADIFDARRDEVFSHFAMLSVILGIFLGFFVVLRKQVLKPMRELTRAAAQLSHGSEEANELLAHDDEFAVLAQSLAAMRGDTAGAGVPDGGPSPLGGGLSVGDAARLHGFDAEPGPALESALQSSSVFGGRRDKEIARAFEAAVDAVFEDIVGVGPVRSIFIGADIGSGGKRVMRGLGIELVGDHGAAWDALLVATRPRRIATVAALEDAGVEVEVDEHTRAFYVYDFRVGDVVKGRMLLGLAAGYESGDSYLGSTLALFAAQIASLIDRGFLYERLRAENAQKNRMLGHLFEAEAEERKRIARGIHDQTAQDLTALLLLLETFPQDPERQKPALDRARAFVGEILDGTDRLIRRLRPAVLDDLGLVEAVRAIGFNLLEPAGIAFEFTPEGEGNPIPKRVEVAVFRVMQEAATNIVRHSGAKRVTAKLAIRPDRIACSIADDGRGMDLSWLDDAGARPRWGVLGMRERITQMGGLITFSAPAGGGVQIDIEVPFASGALDEG